MILPVKPSNPVEVKDDQYSFIPYTFKIDFTKGQFDPKTKSITCSYELTALITVAPPIVNATRYEKGTVMLPTDVVNGIFTEKGEPNFDYINAVLASYHIGIDDTRLDQVEL